MEEKAIKPNDPVTIEYTAKSAYHKAGTQETVHRVLAEKFVVKKGIAKIVKKEE